MKKIFTLLLVFLAVVKPAAAEEEQKFVNPLFYKTMEPVSTGTWRTKITPTSMVSDNKGTVLEQKCTLIENTIKAVTLKCEGAYEKSDTQWNNFVLKEKGFSGLIVYQYSKYSAEEKYVNRDTLVIPNDEEKK